MARVKGQEAPVKVASDAVFPCGGPVSGVHLVGREAECARLTEMLGRGQSMVLAGPRRFGKTSLLLEVLRRLREQGLHTTFVDLFEVTGQEGLAGRLVGAALENEGLSGPKLVALARQGVGRLKERLKLAQITAGGMEVLFEFGGRPNPRELLRSALDFPNDFAAKHKAKAVVVLDEVGELLNLGGEELIKLMRARFQQHEQTTYLFSGSQESLLTRLFTHKAQAFYGFARMEFIGPVAKEAWLPYIQATYASQKMDCPIGVAEEVLALTGGHPYYTQYLCQTLFYLTREAGGHASIKALEVAWNKTLDHHRVYFDELWGKLRRISPIQRELVLALALDPAASPYSALGGEVSSAAIYRALQSLVDKGLLKRQRGERGRRNGSYRHLDPLFVAYLRRLSGSFEEAKTR